MIRIAQAGGMGAAKGANPDLVDLADLVSDPDLKSESSPWEH